MLKGLLGVEIADNAIRYIYLEKQRKQYNVIKVGKLKAKISLSNKDSLYNAFRSILENEKIKPKRIFVSISRRDTIVHQVILPKMSSRELTEVISGEIEKIPIFYHQEFEYIYKKYPYSREKNKVVYAALSRRLLNFIIKEVNKTKILFRDLDIASLNLKEVLPATKKDKRNEAFLMIQDNQSHLIIYDNNKFSFLYKSSLGLEHLSLSPSSQGREHALSSLSAEIKRAIKSYLSDNRNAEINFIWLIWDKEVVFDLDKKIANELGVDVEVLYLRKIQDIKVTKESQLNPVYVIALTPILLHIKNVKEQFPLTHFFRNIQLKKYLMKVVFVSLIFITCLCYAIATYYQETQSEINKLSKEIKVVSKELALLNKDSKNLYKEEKKYLAVRKQLLDQATYVARLNRVSWSEVFAVVANELPNKMALSSFKFTESGRARIRGQAFTMDAIAELIRNIDDSSILEKGKFDYLKETKIEETKLFDFGIFATLKQDKESSDALEDQDTRVNYKEKEAATMDHASTKKAIGDDKE